jgi:hypothetical protein
MSAPFVTQLRSRPGTIKLSEGANPRMTIRVEIPDVWDTVRIDTFAGESVAAVKRAALRALAPDEIYPDAFVVKLNGFEVLDESAPVTDAGAVNGSIFLVTYRRRRPVR